MKSELRFKKTAVLLLAASLIGTALAAFFPYALEPLLQCRLVKRAQLKKPKL